MGKKQKTNYKDGKLMYNRKEALIEYSEYIKPMPWFYSQFRKDKALKIDYYKLTPEEQQAMDDKPTRGAWKQYIPSINEQRDKHKKLKAPEKTQAEKDADVNNECNTYIEKHEFYGFEKVWINEGGYSIRELYDKETPKKEEASRKKIIPIITSKTTARRHHQGLRLYLDRKLRLRIAGKPELAEKVDFEQKYPIAK